MNLLKRLNINQPITKYVKSDERWTPEEGGFWKQNVGYTLGGDGYFNRRNEETLASAPSVPGGATKVIRKGKFDKFTFTSALYVQGDGTESQVPIYMYWDRTGEDGAYLQIGDSKPTKIEGVESGFDTSDSVLDAAFSKYIKKQLPNAKQVTGTKSYTITQDDYNKLLGRSQEKAPENIGYIVDRPISGRDGREYQLIKDNRTDTYYIYDPDNSRRKKVAQDSYYTPSDIELGNVLTNDSIDWESWSSPEQSSKQQKQSPYTVDLSKYTPQEGEYNEMIKKVCDGKDGRRDDGTRLYKISTGQYVAYNPTMDKFYAYDKEWKDVTHQWKTLQEDYEKGNWKPINHWAKERYAEPGQPGHKPEEATVTVTDTTAAEQQTSGTTDTTGTTTSGTTTSQPTPEQTAAQAAIAEAEQKVQEATQDNRVYYDYSGQEIDMNYYIHNLSTNVERYIASKTTWGQAQRDAFREKFNKYKEGLIEQLNSGQKRFSTNAEGISDDLYGEFANGKEVTYIDGNGNTYSSLEQVPSNLKESVKVFDVNKELGNFADMIGGAIVTQGRTRQYYDALKQQKIQQAQTALQAAQTQAQTQAQAQAAAQQQQAATSDQTTAQAEKFDFSKHGIKYLLDQADVTEFYKKDKTARVQELRDAFKTLAQQVRATDGIDYSGSNFASKEEYAAALDAAAEALAGGYDPSKAEILAKVGFTEEDAKKWLSDYDPSNPEMAELSKAKDDILNADTLKVGTNEYASSAIEEPGTYSYIKDAQDADLSVKFLKECGQGDTSELSVEKRGELIDKVISDIKQSIVEGSPDVSKLRALLKFYNSADEKGKKTIFIPGEDGLLYAVTGYDGSALIYDPTSHKFTVKKITEANTALLEVLLNNKLTSKQEQNVPEQHKEGGIINKYQMGAAFEAVAEEQRRAYIENSGRTADQVSHSQAKLKGDTGSTLSSENSNESGDYSGWEYEDYARIGAVALNVASIFDPTQVFGAGMNLAADALDISADMADESLSTWDVIKNAGINVGLTALAAMPGADLYKAGRAIRGCAGLILKGLTAFGVMDTIKNAPEIYQSVKNISKGDYTRQDIQNALRGIQAITGTAQFAKGKAAAKQQAKAVEKVAGTDGDRIVVDVINKRTGAKDSLEFKGETATKIRQNTHNKGEVDRLIREYTGKEDLESTTSLSHRVFNMPFTKTEGGPTWWPLSRRKLVNTTEVIPGEGVLFKYNPKWNKKRFKDAPKRPTDAPDTPHTEAPHTEAPAATAGQRAQGAAEAPHTNAEAPQAETAGGAPRTEPHIDENNPIAARAAQVKAQNKALEEIATEQATIARHSQTMQETQQKISEIDAKLAEIEKLPEKYGGVEELKKKKTALGNDLQEVSSEIQSRKTKLIQDKKAYDRERANYLAKKERGVSDEQLRKAKTELNKREASIKHQEEELKQYESLRDSYKEELGQLDQKSRKNAVQKKKEETSQAIAQITKKIEDSQKKIQEARNILRQDNNEVDNAVYALISGKKESVVIGNKTVTKADIPETVYQDIVNKYNNSHPESNLTEADIQKIISQMPKNQVLASIFGVSSYKFGGAIPKFREGGAGNVTYEGTIDWLNDYIMNNGSFSNEAKNVYGRINASNLEQYNDLQNKSYRSVFNVGAGNPGSGRDSSLATTDNTTAHQKLFNQLAGKQGEQTGLNDRFNSMKLGRLPGAGTNDSEKGGWTDGLAGTMTWLRHLGDQESHVDIINKSGVLDKDVEAFWNPTTKMVNFRLKNGKQPEKPEQPENPLSPELLQEVEDNTKNPGEQSQFGGKDKQDFKPKENIWEKLRGTLPQVGELSRILWLNNSARRLRDMAIAAQKPLLYDPVEIHKPVYGNLRAVAEGNKAAAGLMNLAGKSVGSDLNSYIATNLDAAVKGNQFTQTGFKADDDMQRSTAEKSWEREKENAINRNNIAMSNRKSLHETNYNIARLKDAAESEITNNWNTYWMKLNKDWAEKEIARKQLLDRANSSDLARAIATNPEAFGVNLSHDESRLLAATMDGGMDYSSLTPQDQAIYKTMYNKLKGLEASMSRRTLGLPESPYQSILNEAASRVYAVLSEAPENPSWYHPQTQQPSLALNTSSQSTAASATAFKSGGEITKAKVKEKIANSDRFQKMVMKQIDSLDKKLDRISRSLYGTPKLVNQK